VGETWLISERDSCLILILVECWPPLFKLLLNSHFSVTCVVLVIVWLEVVHYRRVPSVNFSLRFLVTINKISGSAIKKRKNNANKNIILNMNPFQILITFLPQHCLFYLFSVMWSFYTANKTTNISTAIGHTITICEPHSVIGIIRIHTCFPS
jgi:hypothetical protein